MTLNETLKKLFPTSYKNTLLGSVLRYLLIAIVAGLCIWLATLLTGWIPVIGTIVGWVLGIAGTIVEIYVVAGIVVSILRKLNVIK